jgi:hypothetical protein
MTGIRKQSRPCPGYRPKIHSKKQKNKKKKKKKKKEEENKKEKNKKGDIIETGLEKQIM